ncbi:MAG: hypothetical protein ACI4N6_01780 [Eubacteriales bacterium]
MNGNGIRTFLSANTPDGFYSFFPAFVRDKTTYIIKGGPGTGKSGLMKKLASRALREGDFVEYVYCSSDPDSLDAVYIPEKDIIAADGTPPHLLEPVFPGACGGIINMGDCWDEKVLKRSKNDIKTLNFEISESYAQGYRYLCAAGNAFRDIQICAEKYLLHEKLDKFTERLILRTVPKKTSGDGKRLKRFLSGVTPKGFITFKDTVYTLCSKIVVFSDMYCLTPDVLEKISDAALRAGYDVYEFHTPICPAKAVHIAIPAIDTAFVTSNRFASFEPQGARIINFRRFISPDISLEAKRLRTDTKLMGRCLDISVSAMKHAKALHDDLEEIYISAMDYGKVDRLTAETIEKIYK